MNSSRLIDISKSSLVGLKAELLKKQEEVKRIKEQQLEPRSVGSSKLQKKSHKKCNKNVEERILKDEFNTEEDFDVVKKSREILEAKARLYDKLKCGSKDNDDKKSQYLIDFDLKQEIEKNQKSAEESSVSRACMVEQEEEENDDHFSDINSDPENDWVDFTDTLGRSKRCLRRDLPEIKAKDVKLAAELKPASPPPATPAAPATAELLSWDMQRELMRQKWEEQETLLLGKKNVHYQDVLFDENRTHGVGYFEFSTDEEVRLRQQEALRKLRRDTEEQQEASVGLRARRQQQLQARLAAARRRKRERLGLPPDSPEPPQVELPVEKTEETQEEEKVKDIEEMISRIAPVRPWDIGKQDSNQVMTQEEWIDKKRQERPSEFAPPSSQMNEAPIDFSQPVPKKTNYFTTKKTNSSKNRNLHNKQDWVYHSSTDPCSSEVLTQATSSSTFTHPVSINTNVEQTVYTKNLKSKDSQSRDWKPTVADIENLLAKTKEQTSGLVSQTSSSGDSSRDPTSKTPTVKNSEEKYHHREKSFCDPLNQKHQGSSIETSHKISELINEVDEGEVSTSNSGNSEFNTKRYNKKWAAIPPPAAMSYYTEENARTKPNYKRSGDMADSLSVGRNLLKERLEEKNNKRLKGLLDII